MVYDDLKQPSFLLAQSFTNLQEVKTATISIHFAKEATHDNIQAKHLNVHAYLTMNSPHSKNQMQIKL